MPKGFRNQYGLGEEVIELNRMLQACGRKILSVTQKLSEQTPDTQLKDSLLGFLGKNGLMAEEAKKTEAVEPVPLTGRERQMERIEKQLLALPEANLDTVLEIAKSFNRIQRATRSKAPSPSNRKRKKSGEAGPNPKESGPGNLANGGDATNDAGSTAV